MDIVGDKLETLLVESGYFQDAPFGWVSLIIRYVLRNDFEPEIGRINKRHNDLPLSIEVDAHELLADNLEIISKLFLRACSSALLRVGERYKLRVDGLRQFCATL